ncbi:MAG: GntR family transcriptional regulator [Pseudonocardiales bacterium]|nr:MAG: GntR family transcriptional regulator [Pseudonocardiales bacterium]
MDRNSAAADLATVLGDWVSAPGPRYRTLAEALSDAVRAGVLVRGDRLPAERRLATMLALSRSTIVAAYQELRTRGIVASRGGSGTIVIAAPSGPGHGERRLAGGDAIGLRQRLADRPKDIITLALAVDDGMPELAAELLDLANNELPALLADAGYHPRGLPILRETIADYYTRGGLPSVAEQILVTNGATQAIGLAAQLYLRRDATVGVETPSWPGCVDIFRAVGARLLGVPMDEEGIRADALHTLVNQSRLDLLFVMPTFHNPTGTLMSLSRRRRVAELCDLHKLPLVEDIAYIGEPENTLPPIAAFGSGAAELLTISGLAKTVWGGLRIGWIRGPAQIIDRLARLKALADLGSAVLDQALAARLIPRVGELTARRAEIHRHQLTHATELLAASLPSWRWQIPDGGPALWIELPGADAHVYAAVALRHGVEIVPGATTDPTGRHDSYLRLPYTFPEETLTEAIRRLTHAWEEFTRHGPPADPVWPTI